MNNLWFKGWIVRAFPKLYIEPLVTVNLEKHKKLSQSNLILFAYTSLFLEIKKGRVNHWNQTSFSYQIGVQMFCERETPKVLPNQPIEIHDEPGLVWKTNWAFHLTLHLLPSHYTNLMKHHYGLRVCVFIHVCKKAKKDFLQKTNLTERNYLNVYYFTLFTKLLGRWSYLCL